MFTARYVLHSTSCPHNVFMCFVWIWEQTAIISLYSIDWLVFITETESVYCAVRSTFCVLPTQCIYVFCVDLRTNSDYFTVQHWLTGFYNWDGECLLRGTGWVFNHNSGQHYKRIRSGSYLPTSRREGPGSIPSVRSRFVVFPCQYHSTSAPYSFIYMLILQERQRDEGWECSFGNLAALGREEHLLLLLQTSALYAHTNRSHLQRSVLEDGTDNFPRNISI